MDRPECYEICVEGHLSEHWSAWFEGLTIQNVSNGVAMLSGTFVDQAALFGVLTKIHALNITLISVNRSHQSRA